MKIFYISLIALFTISLSLFAQPKIEIVGGDTYDWGKVTPKDSPLKAKIKLKNAGNETLNIENVKPTCGCTTAPLDKNKLEPGETATMDVALNITNRNEQVSKSIRISSNDPNNAMKVLQLKANVVVEVEVGPTPYFVYRDMEVGKETESSIKITNNSQKSISIELQESSPDNLIINFPKKVSLKPGESKDIISKIVPQTAGYFSSKVTLKTTHPDFDTIVIPGYGNVKESKIFNN